MTDSADPRHQPDCSAGRLRPRDLLPAAMLLLLGLAALIVTSLGIGTAVPGQYLVVAAPALQRDSVVATIHRAGAGVLGFGALPNIAFAWSEDAGFPAEARAQGAWLVMPATALTGCITIREKDAP